MLTSRSISRQCSRWTGNRKSHIGHIYSADIAGQLNMLGQEITQPVWSLFSVTAVLPPPGQRCRTVCLNSFGNRTSPSDNSNNRWKWLRLVSWATAPCVWTLRALTRNLLTYLLRADDDWRTVDTVERKCQTLTVTVHFMWPQELFTSTDPGRLLATNIPGKGQVSPLPSLNWPTETWRCSCWLTVDYIPRADSKLSVQAMQAIQAMSWQCY